MESVELQNIPEKCTCIARSIIRAGFVSGGRGITRGVYVPVRNLGSIEYLNSWLGAESGDASRNLVVEDETPQRLPKVITEGYTDSAM
jgi:hypothetical protein